VSDWYVSSVAYTAVAQWAATHTYAVGNIVRQLAAPGNYCCFRASSITTGISGGSEPSWNTANNATTTDSGVTWTACTGQSAYQHQGGVTNTWTAPAFRMYDLSSNGFNVIADSDRVFLSSDHTETQSTNYSNLIFGHTYAMCLMVSVNRTTGNIPPAAGDITSGASITTTSSAYLSIDLNGYVEGITFTAGSGNIYLGATRSQYLNLKNCALVLSASSGSVLNGLTSQVIILDNVTLQCANAANSILIPDSYGVRFEWKNTPSALLGTMPTTLFSTGNTANGELFVHGVDLSATTGNIVSNTVGGGGIRHKFFNCKFNSSASLMAGPLSSVNSNTVEFINCTGPAGQQDYFVTAYGTTGRESTIILSGGPGYSRKYVSNSQASVYTPHWHDLYIWNTFTSGSHTVTVQIISSATLNNNQIWGELEFLQDSGDLLSGFTNDWIATPLTTAAAQTSSSATWASSPATPVTQQLSFTFSPLTAGLVRVRVYIGTTTSPIYINPQIVIT
jgi:hypothetical protein